MDAKPTVFVSYARSDDEEFVNRIHDDLVEQGFDVWWDRRAIESRGSTFLFEIQEAIQKADRVIAVIGPHALASKVVQYEWKHAALFAKAVTPVLRIGDYRDLARTSFAEFSGGIEQSFANLHCPDFRPERPYKEAFAELVRVLQSKPASLGKLYGVPSLPAHYFPRPEPLRTVGAELLSDTESAEASIFSRKVAVLNGMSGIGKSVAASALVRSRAIRRAYPDGLIWLSLAEQEVILRRVTRIKRTPA